MKGFDTVPFDPVRCGAELDEFGELLASRAVLSESADVLPFFRRCRQLSAFLASYHPTIVRGDRLVGHEYALYGDFRTDLIVGDSSRSSFLFVEFEDAAPSSVFRRERRAVPAWSPRFQRGFGQIADWFWMLSEFQGTPEFARTFGGPSADFMGMLVIGRSADLAPRERDRLLWFRRNVMVRSRHVYCCTFDELYRDLRERFQMFSAVSSLPSRPR